MTSIKRRRQSSEVSDYFMMINERQVDDISLDFMYKPHTITLLLGIVFALVCYLFKRDDTISVSSNVQVGLAIATFFYLIVSAMAFPNGPFTRPHPVFWRCIFGLSVLYMMLLTFILFQDYKTARGIFEYFYPDLKNFTLNMDEGHWGEDCHDLTFKRLWDSIDFFCFAHFVGWMMKSLLVRHYGILWTISILWEITEIFFLHLLPNFQECWWDSFILDILLCNGFGIYCGMQFCHMMEMRFYRWESIKNIQSTTGKIKRAVLQFTPQSWTAMRWLDPHCSYMRCFAIGQLVIFWQVVELNTFFMKHIFEMPSNHPIVFMRIFLHGFFGAPSIRQYFCYVTDTRCKRVGTQCWLYGLCTVIEALVCIKFGIPIFENVHMAKLLLWILVQFIVCSLSMYLCVRYHEWTSKTNEENCCKTDGKIQDEVDDADDSDSDSQLFTRVRVRKRRS